MPLTPYQLPSPKEDTPYTLDLEAMREQGSPFTNKVATDNLTNLRLTHNLERQQYQDELASQHDYANRVLGSQNFEAAVGGLHNLLGDPQGFNIAMGIPEIRRIVSGMSPDLMGAIGQQTFVGGQADIIKKLADAYKLGTEGGLELDRDKFSQLAGIPANQTIPLSLQVEQERTRGAAEAARIQAGKEGTPTLAVPPSGGLGGGTAKMLPGETQEQFIERMRKLGFPITPPPQPPPRPGAPAPAPPARTSLAPNPAAAATPKPGGPNPLLGKPTAQDNAFAGEPTTQPDPSSLMKVSPQYLASWNELKNDGSRPTQMIKDVDAYVAKHGTLGIDPRNKVIYGITPSGGYIRYSLSREQ